MPRIRLTVQYDGTDFSGWQVQPGARTVQGVLERGLGRLHGGAPVRLSVAGRTDAGVHAEAQVASFEVPRPLPVAAYVQGLNALLPADVAVLEAAPVPEAFDPRRWAHGKRYVYRIWNAATRSPLRRRRYWEVFRPLDIDAMHAAARLLLGEHDFKSFQGARCAALTTVRILTRLDVEGVTGGELSVTVEATAFLKHMVRNLVGTLVEVGLGLRSPDDLPEVLAARSRAAAGRTAPAHGLTLEAVYYGTEPPRRRLMGVAEDEADDPA